jgi:hypothetical protein
VQRLTRDPLSHPRKRWAIEHAPASVAPNGVDAGHALDLARYHRHFLARSLRPSHDLTRSFADERGAVERTFGRYHEVGFREGRVETGALQDPVRTGRELGLREKDESCGQTPGRPSHRHRSELRAAGLRPELRQTIEAGDESLNLVRSSALLRAEHGSGALGTNEWRRDIGERDDARRQSPSRSKRRDIGERAAAVRKLLAVRVLERPPEAPRRACSAVNGGRAAQSDNNGARATIRSGPDQLTDAARGGAERITIFRLHEREAAG